MPIAQGSPLYPPPAACQEWSAGVCHKRGANSDLPNQWIVYVHVEDIAKSAKKCLELGGKILKESKNEDGGYQYVLIEDPAGACLALTKSDQ